VCTYFAASAEAAKWVGGREAGSRSYLPGRRVLGVRVAGPDEPVEVAAVVRLAIPLPQLARELTAVVRGVLGPVRVDVTFCDVVEDPAAAPEPVPTGPGHEGRLA
jgi:hypothetical protein